VELCDMYTWLSSTGQLNPMDAFSKTESHIQKALEIDSNYPDIYRIISNKQFWIEWNVPAALESVSKALEGKPSFPDAMVLKGLILSTMGRAEEALDLMFQAERLNPYSDSVNYTIGMLYHLLGDHAKALDYVNKNIERNPGWDAQYYTKIEALCSLGRYKEAMEVIESIKKLPGGPMLAHFFTGYAHASQGNMEEAGNYARELDQHIQEGHGINPIAIAFSCQILTLMGNKEKALEHILLGIQYKSAPLLFIKIDSMWDSLRDTPKFQKAMNNIVPTEWETKDHETPRKYKKTNIPEKQAHIILEKLESATRSEKPYLNPTLTLYELAEMVDASTNQLSQVLNEFLGKNFYDYLNTYRLRYFLSLYNTPEYQHYTLLALAYESGFNSKTTFNAFFKKIKGQTPSQYFSKQGKRPGDQI
jgi:tetratricopeptide (TPR) repeat protein